ncbi:XTP/dITP diphosphatase [Candidatus Bathyarchaeota archaeon]|nr:XTP/dITP diphosphatase [Candidatus Bathyarchaeota archaeon]
MFQQLVTQYRARLKALKLDTSRLRSPPPRLVFVTSNRDKVIEAKRILQACGVQFKHLSLRYPEIQDSSLRKIALTSAISVYRRLRQPLFTEDSGLFIEALGGFPGPYSSYVQETIGNIGILRLMEGVRNRSSRFESVVAYVESPRKNQVFTGSVEGRISIEERGSRWGFDPIFIPSGTDLTFAEMGPEAKQKLSHRAIALGKFASWLIEHGRKR